MPWRWGIAAAMNLFVFLFLVLQLLIGYSLESTVKDAVAKQVKEIAKAEKSFTMKQQEIVQNVAVGTLHRTFWLGLAELLHLAAILSAIVVYRSTQYPNRPPPRVTVEW